MNKTSLFLSSSGAIAICLSLLGCQPDPATASVVNGFSEGSANTLIKVWYRTTLFVDAVGPGEESSSLPVGTGSEPAYALIALDYDAEAGTSSQVVVVRTRDSIETQNDDHVRLSFSPTSAVGPCFGDPPVTLEEYDAMRERIFPGDTVQPLNSVVCDAEPAGEGGAGGALD